MIKVIMNPLQSLLAIVKKKLKIDNPRGSVFKSTVSHNEVEPQYKEVERIQRKLRDTAMFKKK